jgi:3-hydroxybutyrate dehydrogenase
MSEADVIQKVMLKETVDGEFTIPRRRTPRCAAVRAFPSNALTGQSLIVSHGWHME